MMRMRTPNRNELTILSASALAVVSAVFAVHFWMRRGVCIDSVVCVTISVLSLAGAILLTCRMSRISKLERSCNGPIYLVMRSGPSREPEKKEGIRGKRPDELDH